jgi:hypothetical protein
LVADTLKLFFRTTAEVPCVPSSRLSLEGELSAKSGEVSRETARFRCEGCGAIAPVRQGAVIVDCENCGCGDFQTGWRTLETRKADPVFAR